MLHVACCVLRFKTFKEKVLKLIVGLGNPGGKYAGNRHNAGFMALERYTKTRLGARPETFKLNKSLKSLVLETASNDEKVLLVKPGTFMNKSGQAVRAAQDYFQIANENTLIIYDELALPFGTIRARQGGESAGHNGIKSVIAHCGGDFNRLRVGVANQYADKQPADKFVLSDFSSDERTKLPEVLDKTSECIDMFIKNGLKPETHTVE